MALQISDTTPRIQYTATSGQTSFSVPFEFFDVADLKVYNGTTLLTYSTSPASASQYSVTGAGVTGGGSITLGGSGATLNDTITIVRDLAIERISDFPVSGNFPIQTLNTELDKIVAMLQQLEEQFARTLQYPVTTTTGFAVDLPELVANRVLSVNADATALLANQELGTFQGDWAASTSYQVRDLVKDTSNGNIYFVNAAHTSSGTEPLSTNTNSAKYDLIVDAASATTSATNAASSATAASTSATSAANSATAAATSETNAATSESNASTSETNAATSATNASNSATAAATSATNAATSESNASTSETNAATSATNAASSATSAASSATTATTKASEASTSATNAATSETNAATSASNASTSATNAATSATNASNAQTAAETAQAAAEAALDSFDDRYLGAKASDPSVDNDGDPLNAGDTYYDTTNSVLKVYNGSSWDAIQQGVTDTALTRHSIRPSLNLDFANSKTLDPRITFTRGSSGVYYDGYSSVKAEENLNLYSEEFDNGAYQKQGITSVSANAGTAPDGTTTADKIFLQNSTGDPNRVRMIQAPANAITEDGTYVLSAYFKQAGLKFACIRTGGTARYVVYDLSTQTVQDSTSATSTGYSITDVGNGWYRVTLTMYTAPNYFSVVILDDSYISGDPYSYTATGDGSSGVLVWGAQVEKRDNVSSYTKTTSAQITKYQPQLQTAGSNIARFDHNPTTGESLGLLIEEQRTNIITNSETTDSTQNGSRTLNEMIAPDGTLTADRFNDDTVNGRHRVFLDVNFSATAGTVYTYSVYVKIGLLDTVDYIGIVEGSGALWVNAIFDPSNNWSYTLYNADSASAVDVGNGWYRISMTYTRSDTGNGKFGVAFYTTSSSTDLASYTGTGYNHFYTWGGQIEEGSFPTSYIKTTGSTATRSADDAVMTGSNFTDWFNNQEGTLYVNCNINFLSETNIGAVSLGDSSNRIEIRGTGSSTNNPRFDSVYNGTAQMAIQIPSLGSEKNRRLSLSYNMNDYNISTSANGNSVNKDVSGNIPIINSDDGLKIGKNAYTSSSQQLGGTIKKVSYYPIALTDNEIQDLTEA